MLHRRRNQGAEGAAEGGGPRNVLNLVSRCNIGEIYVQCTMYCSGYCFSHHAFIRSTPIAKHVPTPMCCSTELGIHRGDWYFPDGTRLPFSNGDGDIYEDRDAQTVDLRHRNNANTPVGIYCCDFPTEAVHSDDDVRDTVYVGLYTTSGGMGTGFVEHFCRHTEALRGDRTLTLEDTHAHKW